MTLRPKFQPTKRILIIGAGPGGLTSAMLLASRGFSVTVLEKNPHVGGRNAAICLQGFKFDTGPTFLMLKQILDEVFEEAGRRSDDYLKFIPLDPMYALQFADISLQPTTDRERMKASIEKAFPGQGRGLGHYYRKEKNRFDLMYPCLQKEYSSFRSLFSREFLRALPRLSLGRSLMDVLGDYFRKEKLQLAFTFQAKYLGMSPWECPGAFGILSFVEHAYGVYHVLGGLSEISESMAKVVRELGGDIRTSAPVKQLLLSGRSVTGVVLESGETLAADEVVLNADFAQAMTQLVPSGVLRKYSPEKLRRKKFSCSTFMLYLGLDKLYDMPHHTIVFAENYRANVEDIFKHKRLSQDISFYVRNASITDPSLAPKGKSAVYVLVPVANRTARVDWKAERSRFRDLVLDAIAGRTAMSDLRQHIEVERIITPDDWEKDYGVYVGATFNLGHQLSQMLYLRPHNRFEELDHCYLVGGGTHPGSGLPTIYESGRIAANLICKRHQVPYVSKNLQV